MVQSCRLSLGLSLSLSLSLRFLSRLARLSVLSRFLLSRDNRRWSRCNSVLLHLKNLRVCVMFLHSRCCCCCCAAIFYFFNLEKNSLAV
jgi:hypothetical protein